MRRPGFGFVCVRFALLALALSGAPAIASAQDARYFLYFAPGHQVDRESDSQIYAAGVGLERTLASPVAVQVDVAALSYFNAEPSRTVGGIASFDGVFKQWLGRRVEVLAVGGYSVVFGDDTTNMGNVGGGLRHWFSEDRALLVEFRYHHASDTALLHKFWTIRIGLAFR